MAVPLKLENIIPFFEAKDSFRFGDLPDDPSEAGKVAWVRKMVELGLLRIDSVDEKPPMTVRELEQLLGGRADGLSGLVRIIF